MFAKRMKSADVSVSLQRFIDLHRDSASRTKHLKLVLEALCLKEKRQFVNDYRFECFHLVDELILQAILAQTSQSVIEVESALWTLEQMMCYAPELIGNGWQQNAIELILKRVLSPHNLLVVRKMGIRLFLLWYQSLAVFGNGSLRMDTAFQCLLLHFPLRSNKSAEYLLRSYCESDEVSNGPGPTRSVPLVANASETIPTFKEKAQQLQVYMDKFLEYCSRETSRIEWCNESKRLDCAKFILDRVIVLYIYEVFPDIETKGVDIYGGWESSEEHPEVRDVSDPLIIARYWLIRWMTSIASCSVEETSCWQLYNQALFSSQKATNTLLTLLKEAIVLPLPCSNVIHKVFSLIGVWLVQRDLPPFISEDGVRAESFYSLLIHFLLSFFNSPYLITCGDRLSSALALTQSLLQMIRDLSSPAVALPVPLSASFWCDLLRNLADGVRIVSCRSDAYGRAASGTLVQNLLVIVVFIRAIRGIEIADSIWDDIWAVFQMGCWLSMIEQWSRIVDGVTRALVLNLFDADIANQIGINQSSMKGSRCVRIEESRDDGSGIIELGSDDNRSETESFSDDDQLCINAVVQKRGDAFVWLRIWMRIMNLVSPLHASHTQIAIQTATKTLKALLRVSGTDSLIHWVSIRLLLVPPSDQINCIPAFCYLLYSTDPPPLLQASVIVALKEAAIIDSDSIILDYLPSMSHEHVTALARPTLNCLAKLVDRSNYSPRSIQVAALLSPDHSAAEALLMSVIDSNAAEISLQAYTVAINALTLLIIERADTELLKKVFANLRSKREKNRLIYLFCSNLCPFVALGKLDHFLSILDASLELITDDELVSELLWRCVAVSLNEDSVKMTLIRRILRCKNSCLEGFIIRYRRQFPLSSFSVSLLNSVEHNSKCSSAHVDCDQMTNNKRIFIDQKSAFISVDDGDQCLRLTSRTPIGKHSWSFKEVDKVDVSKSAVNHWLRYLKIKPKKNSDCSVRDTAQCRQNHYLNLHNLPRVMELDAIDCSDMYSFIQQSRRTSLRSTCQTPVFASRNVMVTCSEQQTLLRRSLISDFSLLSGVRQVSMNFDRDLRYLDQIPSRELHKVAIIYVARGQEDKNSILMNSIASDSFNKFVDGLGWPVKISSHLGYCGGLSGATFTPYYASSDAEIVFHVSTWLLGDIATKIRHLGNDEVHVVWSEHDRPYRRDTIATQFCDVLIIIYQMTPVLVRISIETQQPLEFGPLFDGAHVHVIQLPYLIRNTVISASKAYRLLRPDFVRPLQQRQKVFLNTRERFIGLSPADAMSSAYIPGLTH